MDNNKTVSWYIHSFQLYFPNIRLHTYDRQVLKCTAGQALLNYGHYRVRYAFLSNKTAELILADN